MSSFIVLIGDIPRTDLELIQSMAKKNGLAIEQKASAEELGSSLTDIALGYISYLSCNYNTIKNLFGNLPIGSNEHFPLFQKIDNGNYTNFLNEYPATGVFETPLKTITLRNIFNTILFNEKVSVQYKGIVDEVLKYRKQKYQLLKLSTALSRYNDLNTLLKMILSESCDIIRADAGSIYIRDRAGPGRQFTDSLRFKVCLNDSIKKIPTEEYTIKIDKNRIAGYVACTGEVLNIKDVYNLDKTVPFKHLKDFDMQFNYRTKSMLTVPLKNFKGEVVGVLQLINKKKDTSIKLKSIYDIEDKVIDFTYSDEDFLCSIGSITAVSIERTQLHENIEQIFEGFLGSSIAAIDERDSVTSGHSRRVMGYVMAFIDEINRCKDGVFSKVTISEDQKRQFKFAALLHDIGKIGVPEGILIKESRMNRGDFASILSRFDLVRFQFHIGCYSNGSWSSIEELEKDRAFLKFINRVGYINDRNLNKLQNLKEKTYIDSFGKKQPLLTDEEFTHLSIRKGNLTSGERKIINSHAISSQRILSKIPWTPELEDIPKIASQHHEMVDGSGYPLGLAEEELSLESKILAVVDIYDAIIAQDRPYKPAMPPKKAIEILKSEAQYGRLNSDVVNFFIEKDIYKLFFEV
ncbi:MAG: HD domain-containing phosphohydrolase [Chitinispirillia bacterium]|jgi:HD-GYP domain-containing protein (c-di-GMP phosphodiesterase class II)